MSAPRALVLSALSLGTGSGLRAQYLAEALRRLGWEARLAAPVGGPLPYSAEMLLGAPRLLAAGLGRYDLAVAVKPYPDAWLGLAAARLRGAVTVLDIDDHDGAYRGGALGALTRWIQAPAFKLAPWLSTHHPLLREELARDHGAARLLDLPQGVDLQRFAPRRPGAPRPQGLHDAAPLIAFTAHLNVACQLDALLGALGPWLRAHPQAVLAVAGGGPDAARFKALAAPLGAQVRFLGPVVPDGAAALLAAADLSVSAYGPALGNRYRVPMKVAESLAVGTPVVSNLIPGLAAMEPFIYAAELEPSAFGAAVDRACASEDGRTARGQAWVRAHLDWTRVAAGLIEQLRERGCDLPFGSPAP